MIEKTDRYIDFAKTDHAHPYDDPVFLALEEKISFISLYKRPFTEGDIHSLEGYRKSVKRDICGNCTRKKTKELDIIKKIRVPRKRTIQIIRKKVGTKTLSYYDGCEGCRVARLKSGATKAINSKKKTVRQYKILSVRNHGINHKMILSP